MIFIYIYTIYGEYLVNHGESMIIYEPFTNFSRAFRVLIPGAADPALAAAGSAPVPMDIHGPHEIRYVKLSVKFSVNK